MHVSRGAILAVCATLLLSTAAACGSDNGNGADAGKQVRLYGADGNMINSFGEEFEEQPGLLAGMKGTKPLTPLSDDFMQRLHGVNPKLNDYLYAGETYDAVVISALAAELAGTTAPKEIAKYINGVTTDGMPCDTPATCLPLARAGKKIHYRGISLRGSGFTDVGEPSTASYATLLFDQADMLDDGKTEFVGAGDESATTKLKAPAPKKHRGGDGSPLKIGGLLPQTGDLAIAYPPMIAGAQLAIQEINAAGGALGDPVRWIDGDDGTDPDKARQTVRQHIAAGVHVIIGAAGSSISRAVLPVVVDAGLVLFSPSNTDAGLSTIDDEGLYFRTAPPDNLQGKALTDVIMRDGPDRVVIVARKDSYGEGLQNNVKQELEKVGLSSDRIKLLTYEPPSDADTPVAGTAEIADQIKQFGADAVLIIGFSESADVIKAIAAAKIPLRH